MPESLNYIHFFFYYRYSFKIFNQQQTECVSDGHINEELCEIKTAIIVKIPVRRHDGYMNFVM